MSRGYGFIRFPTLEDAVSFEDEHHAGIRLHGGNSAGGHEVELGIAFSRERDNRVADKAAGEWKCHSVSLPASSAQYRRLTMGAG